MDSMPERDLLTTRQSPPPLTVRDVSRTAFAIICSPTTYGTPLQSEMTNSNRGSEYITVRNAAILRRECLKLDYVNPVVFRRNQYLRKLQHLFQYLDPQVEFTKIVSTFIQFMNEQLVEYNTRLTNELIHVTSVIEYQSSAGQRLDELVKFNNHDPNAHKLMSENESIIKSIAHRVSNEHTIMKYLLLSTGYTSCIVRLSNNDDETRFFPVLLDRERSLLGYHLKRLGEDHLPPALPVNIEQTICQLWPTSITIDRGTSHDFFLLQESSELNEFKRIPNPRTDVLPDSSPTTRDQNTGLLRLLTTSSSAENSPVISKDETFPSPMNAKPQSKHVTNRDSDGSNSSFKQQLRSTSTNSVGAYKPPTSERPVSYPSGRQRATPGDRIMNEAHLDNLLAFNHVPSTLRSSTDAQVITLKNDDRTAYIRKVTPKECPPTRLPGEVIHVSVFSGAHNTTPVLTYSCRSFIEQPSGVFTLFFTKVGRFNAILGTKETATAIKLTVVLKHKQESVEILKSADPQWFVYN